LKRLHVIELGLSGLKVIERQRLSDPRGYLSRLFCRNELGAAGWMKPIAQINHTRTIQKGSIRGIHLQYPPHTEMKLVTCIRGKVWDVAVDLRANSPTFMKWEAQILSAENSKSLLIPEGFGHGFQTMQNDSELLYLHTEDYAPEAEVGLRFDDPSLSIDWPIRVENISIRDASHPFLTKEFKGIDL
jgi:dTDP-4-dehydrorhamnose 3,5-epimerase